MIMIMIMNIEHWIIVKDEKKEREEKKRKSNNNRKWWIKRHQTKYHKHKNQQQLAIKILVVTCYLCIVRSDAILFDRQNRLNEHINESKITLIINNLIKIVV